MVSKSEYFTINLADYEILEDLGVVYGAGGQCLESDTLAGIAMCVSALNCRLRSEKPSCQEEL
jgi:hypothetical protein